MLQVIGERQGGPVQRVLGDLLEVDDTAGTRHPAHLSQRVPPGRDVVHDAGIEHRVISPLAGERGQVGGVGHGQTDPLTRPGQPPPSAGDLPRI